MYVCMYVYSYQYNEHELGVCIPCGSHRQVCFFDYQDQRQASFGWHDGVTKQNSIRETYIRRKTKAMREGEYLTKRILIVKVDGRGRGGVLSAAGDQDGVEELRVCC